MRINLDNSSKSLITASVAMKETLVEVFYKSSPLLYLYSQKFLFNGVFSKLAMTSIFLNLMTLFLSLSSVNFSAEPDKLDFSFFLSFFFFLVILL